MMDRLKDSVSALVRQFLPARLDYAYARRARLVAQSADGATVDLDPDDPAVPAVSGVPLRHGIPGMVCKVAPGAYLLLAFDGPQHPHAELWEGGEHVNELTFAADTLYLGAQAGAQPAVLGDNLEIRLTILEKAFLGHSHASVGTPPVGSLGPLAAVVPTAFAKATDLPIPGTQLAIKATKAKVA